MGGIPPIGFPTDTEMRRMEREPRLPRPPLEFWRAYRSFDWHHELRTLAAAKLVYLGTEDRAIKPMRRLRPVLEGIGCSYLEFDGLDHRAAGLDDPSGQQVVQAVADWLDSPVVAWAAKAEGR